jgi:tetratricopeptide (TPR) repeat protein
MPIRRIFGAAWILLAGLQGCAGFYSDPHSAEAYHSKANEAYKKREYATALSLMDSSIATYSGSVYAWANKAWIQTRLKKYEGALSSYNVCIGLIERADHSKTMDVLMPYFGEIYWRRGQIREELGDTTGALRDKRMAKKFDAEGPKPPLWQRLLP